MRILKFHVKAFKKFSRKFYVQILRQFSSNWNEFSWNSVQRDPVFNTYAVGADRHLRPAGPHGPVGADRHINI